MTRHAGHDAFRVSLLHLHHALGHHAIDAVERGIPDSLKGSIVALGNFDGFHLGHQAVVGRAVARAFHERRPVIVATFDPHPVRFFKPDLPPFRLTTLDQRERLFGHAGADAMLVFEFDRQLVTKLEAQPGIQSVALSSRVPLGFGAFAPKTA